MRGGWIAPLLLGNFQPLFAIFAYMIQDAAESTTIVVTGEASANSRDRLWLH